MKSRSLRNAQNRPVARKQNNVTFKRGFRRVVKLVPITRKIITAGPIYEAFGNAIREARQDADMTQGDLGLKVGLTRTSIVNIEQGRQRVLLDDLFVFAKALKVKPQKLFSNLSE